MLGGEPLNPGYTVAQKKIQESAALRASVLSLGLNSARLAGTVCGCGLCQGRLQWYDKFFAWNLANFEDKYQTLVGDRKAELFEAFLQTSDKGSLQLLDVGAGTLPNSRYYEVHARSANHHEHKGTSCTCLGILMHKDARGLCWGIIKREATGGTRGKLSPQHTAMHVPLCRSVQAICMLVTGTGQRLQRGSQQCTGVALG